MYAALVLLLLTLLVNVVGEFLMSRGRDEERRPAPGKPRKKKEQTT
jgi:hypothetical protein